MDDESSCAALPTSLSVRASLSVAYRLQCSKLEHFSFVFLAFFRGYSIRV